MNPNDFIFELKDQISRGIPLTEEQRDVLQNMTIDAVHDLQLRILGLTQQLAASQAREKRLREMLKNARFFHGGISDADIDAALQQPSDGNPPTP